MWCQPCLCAEPRLEEPVPRPYRKPLLKVAICTVKLSCVCHGPQHVQHVVALRTSLCRCRVRTLCGHGSGAKIQLVDNQSIVLGATGTQQTRSSVQLIHTYKMCFLHAKQSLRKPPHAFGSHKIIKSAMVQQCCRRSKCCDLTWLYAGQPNT